MIWSNEGSVEKFKNLIQDLVFREPSEKWLVDCIHSKKMDEGISLMVWGCFWGERKGPLVSIAENINKSSSIRFLERYLFLLLIK